MTDTLIVVRSIRKSLPTSYRTCTPSSFFRGRLPPSAKASFKFEAQLQHFPPGGRRCKCSLGTKSSSVFFRDFFCSGFISSPRINRFINTVNFAPLAQVKQSEFCRAAASEVKCSAYRAAGTLHARSALHVRRTLHVPRERNT